MKNKKQNLTKFFLFFSIKFISFLQTGGKQRKQPRNRIRLRGKIPKTFYGTLAELVSDGLIAPPKLDDKGQFINTQRGQLLRAANGEVA